MQNGDPGKSDFCVTIPLRNLDVIGLLWSTEANKLCHYVACYDNENIAHFNSSYKLVHAA